MTQPNADTLMGLMMRAHMQSALDNDTNVSSITLRQAAAVGKGFPEAMAAAILMMGQVHGPLTQTRQLLFCTDNETILSFLEGGGILPGFGNAFHKEGIDPAWERVDEYITEFYPEVSARITEVADILSEFKGKTMYPNPGTFTATVAEILDLPWGTETSLAVMGRMPAWTKQYDESRYSG